MNYNDPGYLNPVMNNTVTDYQVSILINSNHASGKEMMFFNFVFNSKVNSINLIYTYILLLQQCLDSVGPFWSASDQSRVGLTEDMQVLFPSLYT